MRRLSLSAFALGAAMMMAPAAMAGESGSAAIMTMAGKGYSGGHGGHVGHGGTGMHRWGPRTNGRWYAGWYAPGGWGAWRQPVYGYVLPRYWIQPSYYIANFGYYGLPAPAYGYGWSRYYDDAVLTDRYGRVYDSRRGIDWSRYEGGYDDDGYYADGYRSDEGYGYAPSSGYRQDDGYRQDSGYGYDYPRPREKRSSGGAVTGAAVGGVLGGLFGNRIAGHGNRTAGTIIGAGVGAIGGGAIGSAADREKDRRRYDTRYQGGTMAPPVPYEREGYAYGDDRVTSDSDYSGRWVGTWHGDDGRTYSGEYRGRYEGDTRVAPVPAPAPTGRPHWDTSAPSVPPVAARPAPRMAPPPSGALGYSYGYEDYPGVVTTTVVQPSVTTTTYIEEEVVYSSPKRRVYRAKAKPRARVIRCTCR